MQQDARPSGVTSLTSGPNATNQPEVQPSVAEHSPALAQSSTSQTNPPAVAVQAVPFAPRLNPATHLAVTNGLIRWWPNLFDVRDEISGQEGVVMGVLPPVDTGAADETDFGGSTGWVQLQPAVTNDVFTLSFWVRLDAAPIDPWQWLIGQETGDTEWYVQTDNSLVNLFAGALQQSQTNITERAGLTLGPWNHVAIARRRDGTSVGWVAGERRFAGGLAYPWPANSRWLSVGNSPGGGDHYFQGGLRDLSVFDRVLTDPEVQALYRGGLPRRPAQNSAARLAATARAVPVTLSTNVVHSPARSWLHRRFTTEDGLPGNVVTALLQARNGHLWVGTMEGLARYDGREFHVLTKANQPALQSIGHRVCSLAEDDNQVIWAGVFGGLLRVRDGQCTAFTNGLPQRYVLQATPAVDGWLWIAGFKTTVPRGPCWLRRYHPESGATSGATIVPGHPRRLVPTTNGVWLATEQPQQMHFWDGRSDATTVVGTVERFAPTVRLRAGPLGGEASVRVWENPLHSSNRWAEVRLGEDRPVFHWHWDARWRRAFLSRWNAPAAVGDWLGVAFGRARQRGDKLEILDLGESDEMQEFACLCPNREGGCWFGTEGDGLHLVQEKLVRVHTTEDGMRDNDVRSVCAPAEGDVWAATGSGLAHQTSNQLEVLSPTANLLSVTCDRTGVPWFSHALVGGACLTRGDLPASLAWVAPQLLWGHPNSLHFDTNGLFWVVCENGLTWIKPERFTRIADGGLVPDAASPEPAFRRYAVGRELPESMFPLGLVEDRDGSVWVGSLAHGLVHVRDGRVERFTQADGLPGGTACVPVHLDEAGVLWLVADGNLARRAGGHFQIIDARSGLPRDTLLDLIPDELGNFWISGKRGIHRVARRELAEFFAGGVDHVHSLTLGLADGLLTPECSSGHYPSMAKTPNGHIWVATRNGLATFDPQRVEREVKPLTAVIDRIVASGRDVPIPNASAAEPCRLRPGSDGQVIFHYAAQTLVNADRVHFRHRLVGQDDDWLEDDLRAAYYANLRPASYEFQVQAANSHGLWNEQVTSLPVRVLPYFWRTWTFQVEAGVLGVAFAGILLWRRGVSQRRIQELRHERAMANEKARIAADMHDELGAALTQISILGEVGKGQRADAERVYSTFDAIAQAAREATSRMSDLVWATNPRHDTLDNLVAFLRQHAASRLEGAGIEARLDFPSAVAARHVSATFRRNLLLVFKEALTNITKHAATSAVTVQLEIVGTRLTLRVTDHGRGFEPASRRRDRHGLDNMERRVRDLAGEFSCESVPGQGTHLVISVPLEPRPHRS